MPISADPVAPAKPMCDIAWPAKVRLRRIKKQPTAPETMATMPPAMKALRMKSYSSIVTMGIRFEKAVCGEHDDAAIHAHHVDRRPIEPGKHIASDDLVD